MTGCGHCRPTGGTWSTGTSTPMRTARSRRSTAVHSFAGFLLGMLQSFSSMNEIKSIIPGIDQIIIYLVAIIVLLVRPRGLMGREGVMED